LDASAVDHLRLNFDAGSLVLLNGVIGLMMFGMALDLKWADFKRIFKSPKAPVIGLVAQFVFLPAVTFLLVLLLQRLPLVSLTPSMALGMMLVAACPGGNLSNVMTYLAGGNAAVSVSMTAVSTAAAIFMTPLNLALWGGLNPATAAILKEVHLDPVKVFTIIFFILGVPLALGMLVSKIFPHLVNKIRKPFKIASVLVFLAVVGMALAANWRNFLAVIGLVLLVVLVHNALALSLGYAAGRMVGLPPRDIRAVSIEVGIQNSALGLTLIFTFFGGLGGMAIIAGWWGVWHIIAGLTLAFFWSRRPAAIANGEAAA
jgi:bile acid:Na+ symporter, BASS family